MYQITFECWSWFWSKGQGMKNNQKIPKNTQIKWNEMKIRKRQQNCQNVRIFLYQNKSNFFLHPRTNARKIHPFLFLWYLDVIWVSSVLFCWVKSCLGTEISSQMKKQQKMCVVCLVSKSKEKGFSIQWQMQKKKYIVLPFLWFFFVVMFEFLSFLLIGWIAFLEQKYFDQIISKIKAKTKTQKTFQFPKDWEKGSKRKMLAHCVKTTVYPLAQKKERKIYFLNSIVVVGNKINMVCVCVCCPMWWLFQPNISISK